MVAKIEQPSSSVSFYEPDADDEGINEPPRNPIICICKNKDADQLCSYCTADQHHCFRYIGSACLLLPKSKIASFQSASVTEAILCRTRLETQIVGFLMQRLIYMYSLNMGA